MKHLLLLAALLVSVFSFAQIVDIPDANFKQRLLNISTINTNGDTEIQVSEAEATDEIFIGNGSANGDIDDVTGIEAFINLERLVFQGFNFTSIDLSNNNSLNEINISITPLENFIPPTNTNALEDLDFSVVNITDVSFITNYPNLKEIFIFNSPIDQIDVTNNLMLENLYLSENEITSLDITNNTNLVSLNLSKTDINNLNLINNNNLNGLNVSFTDLTNLDLSSVNLTSLIIGGSSDLPSNIPMFDLSEQTNLEILSIGGILESDIDLSNNVNLIELRLVDYNHSSINISDNTELEKITVSRGVIETLDLSQQTNLIELGIFTALNISDLNLSSNVLLEILNISNGLIFPYELTTLDLSQNINLREFNLENVDVELLDLSENINLERLFLTDETLNDLILPNSNSLLYVFIFYSQLESLDFSAFNQLDEIWLRYNNSLTNVNLKNGNTENLASTNGGTFTVRLNPNLHFVCVDDAAFAAANFNFVSPYITFTEDCSLNSSDINQLTGDITYDLNNNGCFSGNYGLENMLVSSSDGTNTFATTSGSEGAYALNLGENTYTTGVLGLPSYFEATPASTVDTFVGFNNAEQQDFCVQASTTANDLNISINPQYSPQPGEQGVYNLVYQNAGTTELSPSVTLTFDPEKVTYSSATPAESSQTANTITWDLGPVLPFTTETIDVRLDLFSQPINMEGDALILNAVINPVSGDATPDDNTFGIVDFILTPLTNNGLTVVQGTQVLVTDADDFLNYVVSFENNTPNVVNNVSIFTLFDANLDLNTLQIIDSSHPVDFSMANNEAFFELNNVGLPGGGSPMGNSSGYVMYRLKPRAGIVDGDVVSASINLSLDGILQQTEFVSTIFRDVLGTPTNQISTIKLYPNPTNGVLTIETNTIIKEVKIFNLAGQLLKTESNIQNAKATLNIEEFTTGIYFANVKTENGEKVFKIIKE